MLLLLLGPAQSSAQDFHKLADDIGTLDVARSKVDEQGWGANGCGAVAERVRRRLDYSTDAKEKSQLRPLQQKAAACSAGSGNLEREGGTLATRCNDLLLELMNNAPAPQGSDAQVRRTKSVDKCSRAIEAYRIKVQAHVKVIDAIKASAASVPD